MKALPGCQPRYWMMTALGASLVLAAAPALAESLAESLPEATGAVVDAVENEPTNQSTTSPAFATPVPVPESTLSRSNTDASAYSPANASVVLRLQERRVYLYSGEMLVSSYPVAIGTDETPTPQGQFSVGQMVVNPVWQSPWTGEVHQPGPDSALGVRWIGFASSEAGSFGFHGTPTIESIGTAASNGCVRMYNEDVTALFAQVSVGTPVIVE